MTCVISNKDYILFTMNHSLLIDLFDVCAEIVPEGEGFELVSVTVDWTGEKFTSAEEYNIFAQDNDLLSWCELENEAGSKHLSENPRPHKSAYQEKIDTFGV